MRHLLSAVVTIALLAPLSLTAACGNGGGGGGGDTEGARSALIALLDAARRDDFPSARPRLDVAEWLAGIGHPMAAEYMSLPQDERDRLDGNCFRAVSGVLKLVNLPDQPTIAAAVGAGSAERLAQLKVVTIRFSAPDRERAGRQLTVTAKLRYGMDRVWRMVAIETDL